jgi:hypothetical protein
MDAHASQGSPDVEAPRHLFFGVEDRRMGGRSGLDEKHLVVERSRRQNLAEQVVNGSRQLIASIHTLRAFDRTGDAERALDHIEHTLEDIQKHVRNLVVEVSGSIDRYADNSHLLALRDAALAATSETPAAAVEPSPQQAPAAAGTTSGPVHNHGPEEGAGLDCAERRTENGLRGACMDAPPRVTPLTLVQNTAFSLISASLDEAQRNRAAVRSVR